MSVVHLMPLWLIIQLLKGFHRAAHSGDPLSDNLMPIL